MTTNWMLDELSHAGPEHLDDAYVSGYDRKAQFDPTADIEQLINLGLNPASTVIDFGAGTGVFALTVAPHCRSVIAVDPSPAMITRLRIGAAEAGVTNLSIVQSGFLSYQHTAAPVDFIFTRNALHHLPDFWKGMALARLHTLLTPQGILRVKDLIYDFEPHAAAEPVAAWLAGAVDDPAVGWTAAELAEHVRTEHSTFRWLFEPLLHHAGFAIIDASYQRDIYGTYTCRVQT